MKKIGYFMLLFLWAGVLYGGTGVQQQHLVSLDPPANQVKPDSTFVLTFDKPILQTSVKKHTAVLIQKKPQKQTIPTQVTVTDNRLQILPNAPLAKGIYLLKIKPLKLTKEGENTLQVKTPWQKFIAWLCGLFYKDISKCLLCQYFCYTSNIVKTKPIKFGFEIKEEMASVQSVDSNVSIVEL